MKQEVLRCRITGRSIFLAAIASLLCFGCGPWWRELRPDGVHFSVQLPGAPELSEQVLNTPAGPVPLHCYTVIAGRWQPLWTALYIVAYSDELGAGWDADPLLRLERDRLLEASGATLHGQARARLLREEPHALQGNPGLWLEIARPSGRPARARIYVAARRLYSLYAVDTEPRVQRFFNSLRLE